MASIILVYLQWAESTIGFMIMSVSLYATQCSLCHWQPTREDHKLDIKEIILIVGGLLRSDHWSWAMGQTSRRNRLRMDISQNPSARPMLNQQRRAVF